MSEEKIRTSITKTREVLPQTLKRREEKRKYYIKNRKKILKKSAEYRKNNTDKPKTLKRRFNHLKSESLRRNLEFNITFNFFKNNAKKKCHYCNDNPKETTGSYMDRINNQIGYIESNIVPCCTMCNRIKNTYNEQEFYVIINKIYKNIKERINE